MTWDLIEQRHRADGRDRKRSPEAGLSVCNHELPLLGREPKFLVCHPPSVSPAADSAGFLVDAFLSEQVVGVQLRITDVQRQNIDGRLRDFSEIINKKGRNAKSGHTTSWPVKLNCLLQVLTLGWTVRGFVILWETRIKTYQWRRRHCAAWLKAHIPHELRELAFQS